MSQSHIDVGHFVLAFGFVLWAGEGRGGELGDEISKTRSQKCAGRHLNKNGSGGLTGV